MAPVALPEHVPWESIEINVFAPSEPASDEQNDRHDPTEVRNFYEPEVGASSVPVPEPSIVPFFNLIFVSESIASPAATPFPCLLVLLPAFLP